MKEDRKKRPALEAVTSLPGFFKDSCGDVQPDPKARAAGRAVQADEGAPAECSARTGVRRGRAHSEGASVVNGLFEKAEKGREAGRGPRGQHVVKEKHASA